MRFATPIEPVKRKQSIEKELGVKDMRPLPDSLVKKNKVKIECIPSLSATANCASHTIIKKRVLAEINASTLSKRPRRGTEDHNVLPPVLAG